MRVVHAGKRVAAVVTFGIALLMPIAPANAETAGTLIAEYPLPDGSRRMSDADGSVIEYWMLPSPLHGLLAAQLAAHGVDFHTVLGTGKHTQLNPRMWTAIEQFVARIRSDPAIGNP